MVRIEGTLDEIRELMASAERTRDSVVAVAKATKKAGKVTKRKLSSWQRYIKNKSNHIKFKRGDKKGRLDLKSMSKAFKRSKK